MYRYWQSFVPTSLSAGQNHLFTVIKGDPAAKCMPSSSPFGLFFSSFTVPLSPRALVRLILVRPRHNIPHLMCFLGRAAGLSVLTTLLEGSRQYLSSADDR